MPFITEGKTNLKYLLIVVVLGVLVGGGILGYYYSWIADLDARLVQLEQKLPEVKAPEKAAKEEAPPEEAPPEEVKPTQAPLMKASFPYPYPVFWEEDNIKFDLTGVSFGKRTTPSDLDRKLYKPTGEYYAVGEEFYALTLSLKVTNLGSGYPCVPLNLRRLISEEGDLLSPNMRQFWFLGGGCQIRPTETYLDQEVIFVVPESEKEFYITTGGKTNIFFKVTVLEDGSLKVEKTPTEEKG